MKFEYGMKIERYFLVAKGKYIDSAKFFVGTLHNNEDGDLAFKLNVSKEVAAQMEKAVVVARGWIAEYNGAPQFQGNMFVVHPEGLTDDIRRLCLPCTTKDVQKMQSDIEQALHTITDPVLNEVSTALWAEYRNAVSSTPGGSSAHHAYIGGLLEHTWTMLQAAQAMCRIYGKVLNYNLLISGVILHDIGKLREFVLNEYGLVAEYSVEGNLMGHLVSGSEMVGARACALGYRNNRAVQELQHLLLSHHGDPEIGAAKVPIMVEAIVLHHLDVIDSRMNIFGTVESTMEPGAVSDNIWPLGTRVYKSVGKD